MSDLATTPLLPNGETPDYIGTTSVHELTGFNDALGLSRVPMTVCRLGNTVTVEFHRDPYTAEEFIELLNVAAPNRSSRQSAADIAGDWVFATPEYEASNIAIGHAKIPAWSDFVVRAESYVDLARNADKPHQDSQTLEEWKEKLPEPKPLVDFFNGVSKDEALVAIQHELAAHLSQFEAKAPSLGLSAGALKALADNPTKILVQHLVKAGWKDAPEVLRDIIEVTDKKRYKKLHTNDVISRFSKLPAQQRAKVHAVLVGCLSSDQPDADDKLQRDLAVSIMRRQLEERGLTDCIDKNGNRAYVDIFAAKHNGWSNFPGRVPVDYRQLKQPTRLIKDRHGHFETEQFSLPAKRYDHGLGKIDIGTYTHYGPSNKLRLVQAQPVITWQTDGVRRQFGLHNATTQDTEHGTELPISTVYDGLFGLMTVRFLSRDIELPRKRRISGFMGNVEQDMGAAQLPLLTLMYKKKIESGSLVQAIEAFAHNKR